MRLITKALKELVKTDPNFRKAFIISTRNNLPGLYPSREDGRVWYADKDRVYLSAMTPFAIYVCAKLVKDHGVYLDTRETKQPPYIVLEARQYRSVDNLCKAADPEEHARLTEEAYLMKDCLTGAAQAYITLFIQGKLTNETLFDKMDTNVALMNSFCPDKEPK